MILSKYIGVIFTHPSVQEWWVGSVSPAGARHVPHPPPTPHPRLACFDGECYKILLISPGWSVVDSPSSPSHQLCALDAEGDTGMALLAADSKFSHQCTPGGGGGGG